MDRDKMSRPRHFVPANLSPGCPVFVPSPRSDGSPRLTRRRQAGHGACPTHQRRCPPSPAATVPGKNAIPEGSIQQEYH
jgi:hypothetical protein